MSKVNGLPLEVLLVVVSSQSWLYTIIGTITCVPRTGF
jgi:hypothetical protein